MTDVRRDRESAEAVAVEPDAAPASPIDRARRIPLALLAIAIGFVVLRLAAVLRLHEVFGHFPDSATYRPAAGGPTYEHLDVAGDAMRPWTVPLLYAVLPSDALRAGAQVAISVAAWLTLAGTVAASIRDRRVAVTAFTMILLFGCTTNVTSWDLVISSESLALSIGAFAVAAWLRFVAGPTPVNAVVVVGTTTAWMFTRSQLTPLVVVLAVAVALSTIRRDRRTLKAAVAGSLALVSLWGVLSLHHQEIRTRDRDGYGVGAMSENFALNLRFRILTDAEATQWFLAEGMPAPTGMEPHRRTSASDDAWAGWAPSFAAYRANADLRPWAEREGQVAWVRYNAAHPGRTAERLAADLPAIVAPPPEAIRYVPMPNVMPAALQNALEPTGGFPWWGGPIAVLSVACAAVAIRRRRRPGALAAVALAMLSLAAAGIFIGWLGSAVEVARHAIPFTVALPVALVLLLAALLDQPEPTQPVAPRVAGP